MSNDEKILAQFLFAGIVAVFLLTACQTAQKTGNTDNSAPQAQAESPKETPKDTPKDAQQNTQTVKGINGWEGEIIGKPAKGSKFTKLKIGMTMKQVTKLIGQPSDQGAYVTGKAWIPYYHGRDVYRPRAGLQESGAVDFSPATPPAITAWET